jgi:hypothetical protein
MGTTLSRGIEPATAYREEMTEPNREPSMSERQRANHEAAIMPAPPYRRFFSEVTA